MPTSDTTRSAFSMKRYMDNRTEVSLHMSYFFVGYLKEIHAAFEGDLALVIVLGEIAHHTVSPHFSPHAVDRKAMAALQKGKAETNRLPSCSAYSLASATGLPRETVRRKIKRLIELGWVARVHRAEVRLTPVVAETFVGDFNVRTLTGMMRTVDRIRRILKD